MVAVVSANTVITFFVLGERLLNPLSMLLAQVNTLVAAGNNC